MIPSAANTVFLKVENVIVSTHSVKTLRIEHPQPKATQLFYFQISFLK